MSFEDFYHPPREGQTLRELATYSGADRWMRCSASVALSRYVLSFIKKYADEGTASHKVMADAITNNTPIEEVERQDEDAAVAVRFVRATSPGPYYVEKRFPLLGTSGGIDCFDLQGSTCYLYDYKHGMGVEIDAVENLQLLGYACCLKEAYPEITKVIAYIIQPRVEGLFDDTPNITVWEIPFQTLAAAKKRFELGLALVEEGNTMEAGEWCRFCPARGGCAIHVSKADYAKEQMELLPIVETLPTVAQIPRIAEIYRFVKASVKAWESKAFEFLLSNALQGVEIPGFELGEKRTNRKWHQMMDQDELEAELKRRGVAEPIKKKLCGITEAETQAKKAGFDLDGLTEKPEGGPTLKAIKPESLTFDTKKPIKIKNLKKAAALTSKSFL